MIRQKLQISNSLIQTDILVYRLVAFMLSFS